MIQRTSPVRKDWTTHVNATNRNLYLNVIVIKLVAL